MKLEKNAIIISILAGITMLGLVFFTNIERIYIVLGVFAATFLARNLFNGKIIYLKTRSSYIMRALLLAVVILLVIFKSKNG